MEKHSCLLPRRIAEVTYVIQSIEPLTLYVLVDFYLYNTITITVSYRSLLSRNSADVESLFRYTFYDVCNYMNYCTFLDHIDHFCNFCNSPLLAF